MNSLALNALIKGRTIASSERVRKLAEETRESFIRSG